MRRGSGVTRQYKTEITDEDIQRLKNCLQSGPKPQGFIRKQLNLSISRFNNLITAATYAIPIYEYKEKNLVVFGLLEVA